MRCRLLSVEREKRFNEKGDSYEVTEFSIITDAGEMRNFDLNAVKAFQWLPNMTRNDEVGGLNFRQVRRACANLRRMTI